MNDQRLIQGFAIRLLGCKIVGVCGQDIVPDSDNPNIKAFGYSLAIEDPEIKAKWEAHIREKALTFGNETLLWWGFADWLSALCSKVPRGD